MKLMIVESPGKVEKLSEYLGDGWMVAASVGHISDMPLHEIGVEAPHFRPTYYLTERGTTVVDRLKRLVAKASEVVLATDPDREGEAIAWHLEQCLELNNPTRMTFARITKDAIQEALASPRRIDNQLVNAQEARRVLDRLVGYMVSPELSLLTGQKMSAGRVQSPAVRLVVERDRAIAAFRATKHFGASLSFAPAKLNQSPGPDGASWSADWQVVPDFAPEEAPYFLDREFAVWVSETRSVHVVSFEEAPAKRSPPAPFITSTMQQAGSVALGLDPKETMQAAQRLYELGHISYHRTDNPNLAVESLAEIEKLAEALGLQMAEQPRTFKASASAQAGHPAITPTHWELETAGETPAQQALYKLIRIRAIACQLADAKYAERTAKLTDSDPKGGKPLIFVARGRTLTDPGWLKLQAGDSTEEAEDESEPTNAVPVLEVGAVLAVHSGKLVEKTTKAPARYTQASLIKKLESEGIGRPATYASIMDNILTREYVKTDKKFLRSTPTGELVVDSLAGRFGFIDLPFTRTVEEDLDRIAKGEAGYQAVITGVYERLNRELASLKITATPRYPCSECGSPLRRVSGRNGFFWGCSAYPTCSVMLPDESGKPGQKKAVEVSVHKCPQCGKQLIHHVKKGAGGYNFWGCSGYKSGCKSTYEDAQGVPKLPT